MGLEVTAEERAVSARCARFDPGAGDDAMPDAFDAPVAPSAEETLESLRHDFVDDATEELNTFLSYLNEAEAGNRPVAEVLHDARRIAINMFGGANGFDLPLVAVAAQRLDDYVASLGEAGASRIGDLTRYAETLLDLLAGGADSEETPAQLMRRLPDKGGFDVADVVVREVEVILAMSPGVARRVIERELQECGYRVTTVSNSFKALELVARTLPDLVIVSAIMPDLNGIDICLAMKAMPTTRNVGIAVITSLDSDDPTLQLLPPTVPVIHKSSSFGDDLTQALQDQFLL